MSLKSINAKQFVKDTGANKQLFVFAGSDNSNVSSDSKKTEFDLWNKSDFSLRVGRNSVIPIVPNIKWNAKRNYIPWSSTSVNTGAYYAYNDANQYVYLCISDNESNRSDFRGNNVSNIRPTHTVGAQKYADGYTWKPLYKITPSLERFVTSSWIPVVSFDLFDDETQQNQLSQTQEFCDDSSITEIGKCAIYAKTPLSTDNISSTTEYKVGDLFSTGISMSCKDCYYLGKNSDNFITKFYSSSETVDSTLTVEDEYAKIGNLIAQNQITTSSPYYYLYNVNTGDNVEEGSIISAFIDLSSFTTKQLLVSQENPSLDIASNSGVNGEIKLKTVNISGQLVIDGIEVINSGSGYKDILLGIDPSILLGICASNLIPKITVNLDVVDGLAFDPVEVLNAEHVMIDARIEKKTLEDSGILLPESLNFFSLLENPRGISGGTASEEIITGSNLNKKLDYVFRTTTKIKTETAVIATVPDEDLILDESYLTMLDTPQNVTTKKSLIAAKQQIGITQEAELKSVNYNEIDSLVSSVLYDPVLDDYQEIKQIVEKPVFQQFSGKILSTTKLNTALNISDTDSVIIRINMIKGM